MNTNTEQQNKVWNSLSLESKEFIWDTVDSWYNVEFKDKPVSLIKISGLVEVLGNGIFDRRMDKLKEELSKSNQRIAETLTKCIPDIKPKFKIWDTVRITWDNSIGIVKDIFTTPYGVVYLIIYSKGCRNIRIHENWLSRGI